MLGPTLHTDRLILRPPAAEDFDAYAALMADAEAVRFIGGQQGRSQAWRSWASIIGAWTLNGHSMFSVIDRASGQWVGRLGPWVPDGWPGPEVGWTIVREHWGRGLATEGASAALDWVFDHAGWTEVVHCIDPANTPSIAVAGRLGSRRLRTATLPPPLQHMTVEVYGQTREDWRARRR